MGEATPDSLLLIHCRTSLGLPPSPKNIDCTTSSQAFRGGLGAGSTASAAARGTHTQVLCYSTDPYRHLNTASGLCCFRGGLGGMSVLEEVCHWGKL